MDTLRVNVEVGLHDTYSNASRILRLLYDGHRLSHEDIQRADVMSMILSGRMRRSKTEEDLQAAGVDHAANRS